MASHVAKEDRRTGVLVPSLAMSAIGIIFLVPFVWLVMTAFKTHGNLTLGGGGPPR
jgi:ABC-type glycerol-3-phosphate transport system permease component